MDSYDFREKEGYRARREVAIDRMCNVNKKLRRVAYLDTKEALDTMSYLRRGYRSENLFPINNNPAEIAVLTKTLRAKGFPDVNGVGLDFEDALARRVPDVDVIDFDGMSCLHDKLVAMISRVVSSRPRAVYGATLLGGREQRRSGLFASFIRVQKHMRASGDSTRWVTSTSFGTHVSEGHAERVLLLTTFGLSGRMHPSGPYKKLSEMSEAEKVEDARAAKEIEHSPCRIHIHHLMWDVYISTSHQPMVWVVADCRPHKEFKSYRELLRLCRDTSLLAIPHCQNVDDELERHGIIKLPDAPIDWEDVHD